jgi:hypothetical protein
VGLPAQAMRAGRHHADSRLFKLQIILETPNELKAYLPLNRNLFIKPDQIYIWNSMKGVKFAAVLIARKLQPLRQQPLSIQRDRRNGKTRSQSQV